MGFARADAEKALKECGQVRGRARARARARGKVMAGGVYS